MDNSEFDDFNNNQDNIYENDEEKEEEEKISSEIKNKGEEQIKNKEDNLNGNIENVDGENKDIKNNKDFHETIQNEKNEQDIEEILKENIYNNDNSKMNNEEKDELEKMLKDQ